MAHTYKPYTFAEMAKNTKVDSKIAQRIIDLEKDYRIKVRARNDGDTFVAYSGNCCISRKAVLQVTTLRSSCGMNYVIEINKRPADFMAAIAEILTEDAAKYGKMQISNKTTLTEAQKARVDELRGKMLRARCNRDMAVYYACKGEITKIFAEATGDYSELTGKGTNRNKFY